MTVSKNRYPGPKPFRTDEKDIFFGRDTDIAEFYKYIFLHQSVVLFGKSGYGKSSLINAGIIPLLAEKNKQVHFFEVKFGPYVSGSDRSTPIERINAIIKEKSTEKSSLILEKYFETDDSFWHTLKNYQISHEANEIIFFFDQFEELFTYPQELIFEFKQQLADVLYTTVPAFFRNQEDLLDQEGISEEFRLNFYQKPEIKVVFAIRSDRLAQLEELKDFHPAILKDCYELKGLDKEGALAAVLKPATLPDEPVGTFKTPTFEIKQELAEQLVSELQDRNGRIETSTLQIICWQVEDKFVPAWIQGDEKFVLTFEQIDIDQDGQIKGDIETVFDNYYKDTIETKIDAPFREAAYRLVEEVLVQNGQRIPFEHHYLMFVVLVEQLHIPNRQIAQQILDILREASLLKVEQDSQRRLMYELGHDTLVDPISKAAKLREERDEQIRVWEEAENAKELAQKAQDEKDKANEQAAQFLVLKRRAEVRSVIAFVGFIIAFIVAFYAYYLKREADDLSLKLQSAYLITEQAKTKVQSQLDTALTTIAHDVIDKSIKKTEVDSENKKPTSQKSSYDSAIAILAKIKNTTLRTQVKKELQKVNTSKKYDGYDTKSVEAINPKYSPKEFDSNKKLIEKKVLP
ncbi:GTPase SAR1 family protein [Arcicella rosea]|uniref:nSTAND1 domain-containing NTPase n=1 Tax=Arcicella rosea TaxID=502909 RepID=UPI00345DC2F7